MRFIILRFDAPLMSFGAPAVDHIGRTEEHPGQSMLTGLLANALGLSRGDTRLLQSLQRRLQLGCRRDRSGIRVTDYQTVDLGQPHLEGGAWTTSGVVEERGKGEATSETHIRLRDYWADAIFTVALTLVPADDAPSFDAVVAALSEPARPLHIGRKSCVPSGPLLVGTIEASSLESALRAAPPIPRTRHRGNPTEPVVAWTPVRGTPSADQPVVAVCDERDWENQIHVGRRFMRQHVLRKEGEPGEP